MCYYIFLYLVLCVYLSLSLPIEEPEENTIDDYNAGGADLTHLGLLIYGKPNEESGKKVSRWSPTSEINPEELGQYAEGDILFPSKLSKNGLIAETARWPEGIVPYEISSHFSSNEKEMINRAIEQYHKYTCIRFKRRESSDPDWISIVDGNTGCWSSVGRTGGRQEVNLQTPGCFGKIGTVIHELLHALGFQHEQNRWERDSYVSVHWENIQKGRENNFKKSGKESVTGFGVPYDYGSVMHYSEKAFSKNGEATVTVKESGAKVGQREGFSQKDVDKIRVMYNCLPTNQTVSETNQGYDKQNHREGLLGGLVSILFP